MIESIRRSWKQKALWMGASAATLAWSITLYWSLVAHGYVQTPWVL